MVSSCASLQQSQGESSTHSHDFGLLSFSLVGEGAVPEGHWRPLQPPDLHAPLAAGEAVSGLPELRLLCWLESLPPDGAV